MITGSDLHRLRHGLQTAADAAQMKSGALRDVVVITTQEARDILDALSELVDHRAEKLNLGEGLQHHIDSTSEATEDLRYFCGRMVAALKDLEIFVKSTKEGP